MNYSWYGQCSADCGDKNTMCYDLAEHGGCISKPVYMLTNCKRSCQLCPGGKHVTTPSSFQNFSHSALQQGTPQSGHHPIAHRHIPLNKRRPFFSSKTHKKTHTWISAKKKYIGYWIECEENLHEADTIDNSGHYIIIADTIHNSGHYI